MPSVQVGSLRTSCCQSIIQLSSPWIQLYLGIRGFMVDLTRQSIAQLKHGVSVMIGDSEREIGIVRSRVIRQSLWCDARLVWNAIGVSSHLITHTRMPSITCII